MKLNLQNKETAGEYFKHIVYLGIDGFWAMDLNGGLLDVNEAFCKMLGYSKEQLLKMTLADIRAESPEEIKKNIEQIASSGGGHFEKHDRRKDGTMIDVEISSTYVAEEGGIIFSFVRDITERKKTEQELKNATAFLQATLDSTTDGLLLVDAQGKILSLNKNFIKMWRVPAEILATKSDEKALSFVLDQLKDPDAFLQKVKELYSNPDAESHDYLDLKDGRVFERYSRPQHVGDKNIGRVWSFSDITEHRQAAQKEREHAEELERINKLMIGRETKMAELKEEMKKLEQLNLELKKRLGQA